MNRYIGTIARVNISGKWGFISRKSVRGEDNTKVSLSTTKDIYIHEEDSDPSLVEGLEVSFNIAVDNKRPMAYRAQNVRVVKKPLAGIDLHTDERYVDNPSVGMRWCLTGETHKRIVEGLKKGYGYAYMLVAKKQGDIEGFREIREVKSWKQVFSILTFVAPGEWDIAIILYERTDNILERNTSVLLEQEMRSRLLDRSRSSSGWYVYEKGLPDLQEFVEHKHQFSCVHRDPEDGMPIAAHVITVHVPSEIFAKEPSRALKAFANYFNREPLIDQCDYRRRLWPMLVVGWIPWLMLETLKRAWLFMTAMLALSLLVEEWWMLGDAALEPAVKVSFPRISHTQVAPFNRFDGALHWFTPAFLILYAVITRMIWMKAHKPIMWLADTIIWSHLAVIGTATLLSVTLIGLFVLAFVLWPRKTFEQRMALVEERRRRMREATHELALKAGRRQAELAERQASALMCGDAPAVVTLQAIPGELRTWEMLVAVVKRKVCLPFAR